MVKVVQVEPEVHREKAPRYSYIYKHNDSFGWTYFLATIGSAAYYISISTGFWMGVLGILKAFVWPIFLIFALFKFFGL